jgi:hypothetical protein
LSKSTPVVVGVKVIVRYIPSPAVAAAI